MKQPSPYLKMRVLGAIEFAQGKTMGERIRNVSETTFTDEEGIPRQFTWRTIQTWYYRYKNHGVTGVTNQGRRDKGKPRKISPEELMEAVNCAVPHFRKNAFNAMDVYRFCIEKGLLRKQQIAQTTFYRFIREYDLLNRDRGEEKNKRRLAFAMQYANQLWQADTLFGPPIKTDKGHKPTKLIAFIDDASRLCCHAEFFLEENTHSLIKTLRSAFYKRGIPEQLYVDNGSIYSCQEINLICSRIGILLRHTPVRDGAAKGKIERFFRTVRDRFLSQKLDLSSLQTLNTQLNRWVEEQYNGSNHSAISMRPVDRFGLDLKRIKFLPPAEANDELFYAETTRTVKKDNTFSLKSVRYETPVDLRGKQIQVRFDRTSYNSVILYYKNQRMGKARKLDLIANGLLRRKENP